jgi:hypothetical protein
MGPITVRPHWLSILVAAVPACSVDAPPSEDTRSMSEPDLVQCGPPNSDGSCPAQMQRSGDICCCNDSPPKPADCTGEWWCFGACGQDCKCSPGCPPPPPRPDNCAEQDWACLCLFSENFCTCQNELTCGDNWCDMARGESCANCTADCGPCASASCTGGMVPDGYGGCKCEYGEPCLPVTETSSCYAPSCPGAAGTCQYTKTCADVCTIASQSTTLLGCANTSSSGGGESSGGGQGDYCDGDSDCYEGYCDWWSHTCGS